MVTVCVAPQWHSTVRQAIDIVRAKNPRATEAQALDQILAQGAISIVRAADKVTA
jgi:hypothetical protein